MVTSNDPIFYFTEKQLTYAEVKTKTNVCFGRCVCFIESNCMFVVVFWYAFNIFTTKWSYKWVSRDISWITDSSHDRLYVSCSLILFVDDKGGELFWHIGTHKSDLQQEKRARVFVIRLTVQIVKTYSHSTIATTIYLFQLMVYVGAVAIAKCVHLHWNLHNPLVARRKITVAVAPCELALIKSHFRNLENWDSGKNINMGPDL